MAVVQTGPNGFNMLTASFKTVLRTDIANSSHIKMTSVDFESMEYFGSFSYDYYGYLNGGYITSYREYRGDGALTYDVSGVYIPYSVYVFYESRNDLAGLYRYGLTGNDRVIGSTGNDVLFGGGGNDTIEGGDGFDLIDLRNDSGDNVANGGNQADTILGGSGDDELRGGKGHDSIHGGDGSDTIFSGLGRDTLTGGDGADLFVLRGFDANFPNALLAPTITDFEAGQDKIAVQGVSELEIATAVAAQVQVSGGVQLSIAGAVVTLQGISNLAGHDIAVAELFGV